MAEWGSGDKHTSCAHCKKKGVGFKHCSRCKHASYCGAECQLAAWKGHKIFCVKKEDVFEKVHAASLANDWRGLLKWEGRMGDLMDDQDDACCDHLLFLFATANFFMFSETSRSDQAIQVIKLKELRVQLLGKMQRFRDQGALMCEIAQFSAQCCYSEATYYGYDTAGMSSEVRSGITALFTPGNAAKYYQRARDVGAAHGFFSVECDACLGLGQVRPTLTLHPAP